jgi:hypothetical protein
MGIPQNKQELLEAIQTTHARLWADLCTIPDARAHEATMEGHAKDTLMSPADLVAYLVGWSLLVLKWCDRKAQGSLSISRRRATSGMNWGCWRRSSTPTTRTRTTRRCCSSWPRCTRASWRWWKPVVRRSCTAPLVWEIHPGAHDPVQHRIPNANARTRIRKWKKLHQLA